MVLCGKYISVQIDRELDSYKNINILQYANKIAIYYWITSENIVNIFHKAINLRYLVIKSSDISEIDVVKKMAEKEYLKNITIVFTTDVNLHDVNKIIELKSLDVLQLFEYHYTDYLNSEKIFKILSHIVNNLKKNIRIILDMYVKNDKFRKVISLITYNFKLNKSNYIFTYISSTFIKFDNLYDFNLFYM